MNILKETKKLKKKLYTIKESIGGSFPSIEYFSFGESDERSPDRLFKGFLNTKVIDLIRFSFMRDNTVPFSKTDIETIVYGNEKDEDSKILIKKFRQGLDQLFLDAKTGKGGLYNTLLDQASKDAKLNGRPVPTGFYAKKIYVSAFPYDYNLNDIIFFIILIWENEEGKMGLQFIFEKPRVIFNPLPNYSIDIPNSYVIINYMLTISRFFEIESIPVKKSILNEKPTEVLPRKVFEKIYQMVLSIFRNRTMLANWGTMPELENALSYKFEDTIKNKDELDIFK